MNKPKYVFSQLVAFMDSDKFRHIVDKNRETEVHRGFRFFVSGWGGKRKNSHKIWFFAHLIVSLQQN